MGGGKPGGGGPGGDPGPAGAGAWPAGGTAGTTNGEPPLGVAGGGGPYALGKDSCAWGYDGARPAVRRPSESGGKASGGKPSGPNWSAPLPDVAPGWWPACWPSDVIRASSMTVGRASFARTRPTLQGWALPGHWHARPAEPGR